MSWLSDLLDRLLNRNKPHPVPPPLPIPPVPVPSPGNNTALLVDAFGALNVARRMTGITELSLNSSLSQVAQGWADHLARRGILTHGNFIGRIAISFPNRESAECLAEGQTSGTQMVRALLSDPAHRDIVLDPIYTICGLGVASSLEMPAGLYWVVDFVR